MTTLLLALALAQDPAVTAGPDAVRVEAGGRLLAAYVLKKPEGLPLSASSACYVHPLSTPKGVPVTDVAPDDHRHHRGIFLAWYAMHGKKDADFWGWGQYAPVKDRVILNRSAAPEGAGVFRVKNDWTAEGETLVAEDTRGALKVDGPATLLDLEISLTAGADLRLAKGAFSGFCLRARKDGTATVEAPGGPVALKAPHYLKPETDWPAEAWYAFAMTLPDGTRAGAALIDHPKNPPALWHNPAAIRMLNPCIIAPGEVVLKAGAPLVLRYRCVAFDGPLDRALLDRLAAEWRAR